MCGFSGFLRNYFPQHPDQLLKDYGANDLASLSLGCFDVSGLAGRAIEQ